MREVIDLWLDQGLDFDAIFAASDIAAISLISAFERARRGGAAEGEGGRL